MVGTLSSKGQVVIPAEIRKKYHLKARTKIEFFDTGHSIMIKPFTKRNAFESSRGILKGIMTMDEFLNERRAEKQREDKDYAKKYGIRP